MKTITVTSKMIIDTVEKTLMNLCAFCTKSIVNPLDVVFETEHGKYQLTMALTRDLKSIVFRSQTTYSCAANVFIYYSGGDVLIKPRCFDETHEFIKYVMNDIQKNLEKMLLDNQHDAEKDE